MPEMYYSFRRWANLATVDSGKGRGRMIVYLVLGMLILAGAALVIIIYMDSQAIIDVWEVPCDNSSSFNDAHVQEMLAYRKYHFCNAWSKQDIRQCYYMPEYLIAYAQYNCREKDRLTDLIEQCVRMYMQNHMIRANQEDGMMTLKDPGFCDKKEIARLPDVQAECYMVREEWGKLEGQPLTEEVVEGFCRKTNEGEEDFEAALKGCKAEVLQDCSLRNRETFHYDTCTDILTSSGYDCESFRP
jgi:hypothetical protein